MRNPLLTAFLAAIAMLPLSSFGDKTPPDLVPSTASLKPGVVACGNLIYATNHSSVCFADKFLTEITQKTTCKVEPRFRPVRLDSDKLFELPFCVFSGEGTFALSEKERANLRRYLQSGGFILASPSCSNPDWDKSLRNELSVVLPECRLQNIPMTHPIFSVVNNVPTLRTKEGNTAELEGIEINGRLVMVYSREGLNDVGNAKGCCCCGGNEILQSIAVNMNILTYVLLY